MPVTTQVGIRFAAKQLGNAVFGGPEYTPTIEQLVSWTDGTGADQADRMFFDERTVGASANDDIDLAGSLVGPMQPQAITFVKLSAIMLINAPAAQGAPANVSNLTIGGGPNPFLGFLGGAAHTIGPIRPGGMILLGCGHTGALGTVTPGTADILRIANGAGGTAKYQIALIGRSA